MIMTHLQPGFQFEVRPWRREALFQRVEYSSAICFFIRSKQTLS